jgi:sialate O-acetylesterase
LAPAARADIVLAPLFRDGVVLQRDKPVPVWGAADPGEKITVTFAGKTASATADADGKWRVDIAPLPASAEPRILVARGNNTLSVTDVLVGEVWLASGQSNMELRVGKTDITQAERAAAANPLIRHYKTHPKSSPVPLADTRGRWEHVTPKTVGTFTAAGWYFAVELHRELGGIPVGIINSSYGGTRIEAWMDPASTDKTLGPAFAAIHTRYAKILADYPSDKERYEVARKKWEAARDAATAAGKSFTQRRPDPPRGAPESPFAPSGLYNAMIAPHVPFALRGFLWYQGESNATRHHEYRDFQSALIIGWRRQFAQGDLPFYWVQLANFHGAGVNKTEYAFLRGAQTECLALPNTGQAVTIDIGDVANIHPRNKRDVGRRLALLALRRAYGKTTIVDSGPVFAAAVREGPAMRVSFRPADTPEQSPLASPRGLAPAGFELAGADKIFHPADARIDGQTVLVSSAKVPAPVAVRYAWRNAPDAGLFNRDGLPACPFRSDNGYTQ